MYLCTDYRLCIPDGLIVPIRRGGCRSRSIAYGHSIQGVLAEKNRGIVLTYRTTLLGSCYRMVSIGIIRECQ